MPATPSYETVAPYVGRALDIPLERLDTAFRPAVEADLPRILALRRAVAGNDRWWDDTAFVRWRYFECGEEPSAYWVFEKDREIIGACGLEPIVLAVDGRAHRAVRTLDIMVRPDFDGRGLGAFINLALFRRFPITTVTGSNERSHHLISKMFRHTLDLGCWKAVVRSEPVLRDRLKRPALARTVAAAADLLLALERGIRLRRPPFEIQELARFDDRVTELSLACERPGRIMVRRSAEYLNWRFVRNPRCRYRILGAFDGGRLAGYVVWRLNLARPNPWRVGEIVDWLAGPEPDADGAALRALIGAALQRLVREGAGLVVCMAFGDGLEPVMRAAGLRFRPDQRLPFFVRASDPALHERLASGRGWFLNSGDFDVE
ncbi:MAG TPA: GNAT family N-acetyltransferase [Vicinamibacterales bacterium]|nr:GNAT family N-acetyltransferase [Vicinamibacterales bacterium]